MFKIKAIKPALVIKLTIRSHSSTQIAINTTKNRITDNLWISSVLDIIKLVKDNFKIPVMAYQVSGEYSLLSNGITKGLIDEGVILESLISFKRAGANAIVSYYADRLDKILK